MTLPNSTSTASGRDCSDGPSPWRLRLAGSARWPPGRDCFRSGQLRVGGAKSLDTFEVRHRAGRAGANRRAAVTAPRLGTPNRYPKQVHDVGAHRSAPRALIGERRRLR